MKRAFFLMTFPLICFLQVNAQQPDGKDIPYGEHQREKLDYWQANEDKSPIVFLIPGEGWKEGDKSAEEWVDAAQLFHQQGYAVVGIDYVLSNDEEYQGFPHQSNNIGCALAWTKENASALNGDPQKIILFGSGTGAHLASLHNLLSETACEADSEGNILGVIALAGIYDFDLVPKNKTRAAILDMLVDSTAYWKDAQPIEQEEHAAGTNFLLLHGTSDGISGNAQPDAFYQFLKANGAYPEMEVYDGWGHHLMTDLLNQDSPITQRILGYADSLSRGLKDGEITALQPVAQKNSIQVYPNPSNKLLYVSFDDYADGSVDLELRSMDGKEYLRLHEYAITSRLEIEVGQYPAGLYILNVQVGRQNLRKKVVIY